MSVLWDDLYALTPWSDIGQHDVEPANNGKPEISRTLHRERQFGLVVVGQYGARPWLPGPVLGLIAVRCSVQHDKLVPEMIAIPDTPACDLEPYVTARHFVCAQLSPRVITKESA